MKGDSIVANNRILTDLNLKFDDMITIADPKDNLFDAVNTFECGQCFRWNLENNIYTGISDGRICYVKENRIICHKSDEDYFKAYFSFDTDYADINKKLLDMDPGLEKCIDFGKGIRIIKQDLWETIISFIISANNNIPRIKKIIETMCEMFGTPVKDEVSDKMYYSFPTADKIAKLEREDLAPLKAGYRDKYILDAAQKVASGEVDLDSVSDMSDAEAKKTLMKIKGVGGKVADCILLFSLKRFSVFPTDVWIKRILHNIYDVEDNKIADFAEEKFSNLAGYAQQYLYYYFRSNPEE